MVPYPPTPICFSMRNSPRVNHETRPISLALEEKVAGEKSLYEY